jgi:rhomboid protease GluP
MNGAPPPEQPPPRRSASLRRTFARYPVSLSLIAVTVAVFGAQTLSRSLLGLDVVLALGAKVNSALASGQVWRLLTPLLIHAGWLHLAVNMYSLYILGPMVERFFGPRRLLIVYLLAGVSGVTFSLAFSPSASVGASGAIFGLLGALAAFLYLHRSLFGRRGWVQFRHLVVVALINLALGLSPGIDNWGHVGGLVAGATTAWVMGPRLDLVGATLEEITLVDRRPWRDAWRRALLSGAVVVTLAAVAMLFPARG